MKERPILFSGEMVRAILEGRKTQTRRIIKMQPPNKFRFVDKETAFVNSPMVRFTLDEVYKYPQEWFQIKFPFGKPGDRLWVRETWSPDSKNFYPFNPVVYRGDHHSDLIDRDVKECRDHAAHCEAIRNEHKVPEGCMCDFRWRPSIHMPRWACRITLEIKAVRVERLQDISEEDAKAEGVRPITENEFCLDRHRTVFESLWSGLYGEESWKQNPWVWVIDFEKN